MNYLRKALYWNCIVWKASEWCSWTLAVFCKHQLIRLSLAFERERRKRSLVYTVSRHNVNFEFFFLPSWYTDTSFLTSAATIYDCLSKKLFLKLHHFDVFLLHLLLSWIQLIWPLQSLCLHTVCKCWQQTSIIVDKSSLQTFKLTWQTFLKVFVSITNLKS